GWFEAPEQDRVDAAHQTLEWLGATDNGDVTELGRAMLRVPAQPRIARLLLAGRQRSGVGLAAAAATVISERIPRSAMTATSTVASDVVEQARWLDKAIWSGDRRVAWLERVWQQLAAAVDANSAHRSKDGDDEAVRRCIFEAWPDRVAHRRAPGDDR